MKRTVIIFFIILVIIFIGVLGITLYFVFSHKSNPPLPQTKVKIGETEFIAEVADTPMKRARGLSGREDLEKNSGMLFLFPAKSDQGFWMKDMKFAIDMIWIADDVVVGVSEHAVPEPGVSLISLKIYNAPEPVNRVLEVVAGTATARGIKKGDRVEMVTE